jgi:hypothetical protein
MRGHASRLAAELAPRGDGQGPEHKHSEPGTDARGKPRR